MTDSPSGATRDRSLPGPANKRPSGLSRRRMLLAGSALGVISATAATPPLQAAVHNAPPAMGEAPARNSEWNGPPPAMRATRLLLAENAADPAFGSSPELPNIGVIALNRMAFGPRPNDLRDFQRLGSNGRERLEAYVEQQLAPDTIDDAGCDEKLAAAGFYTLNKSLANLWADHVQGDSNRYDPVRETERAAFTRAVYSKRQLVEVLADHWHNHFNVMGWTHNTAPTFVHYDRDVIRKHSLGNFRQMLEAVAQSPAMLYYLDNQSNTSAGPNENWARELFELHTLGAENYFGVRPLDDPQIFDEAGKRRGYVDDDVYGATTCFTGWRVNTNTGLFEYDPTRHFEYPKLVLGQVIPAHQGIKDGYDVLDMLANHPGTARHVCRRLCRRLIGDRPPESIIQAAADVFLATTKHKDQLKQVVRTILLSNEFRTTWGEKIKRPFEYAVSVLRISNADFAPSDQFFWSYGNAGQALFRWSPPDGYPDRREAWSTTMPMLQRWRLVNWLLGWKVGGEGANKEVLRLPLEKPMPADRVRPSEIVDYWIERILGRTIPEQERQALIEFMAHGRHPDFELPNDQIEERLRYMVGLIFMSPSFHWR